MNSNLQKQLKVYTGVAAAMLAHEKASGQIVYHNYIPDTLIEGINGIPAFLNIDLDNDTIIDFQIKGNTSSSAISSGFCTGGSVLIMPFGNNKIAQSSCFCYGGTSAGNWPSPALFSTPVNINANLSFQANPTLYEIYECGFQSWNGKCGNWIPGSSGCAGFSFEKNGLTYYGWIKLNVISRSSCIVEEYAYQSQPGIPIISCSTVNLSANPEQFSFQIIITQHNNNIEIISSQLINIASVSVFDLLGKKIIKKNFSGYQTEINIDRKGIFIVEVSSDKSVVRKKVYVY